MHIVKTTVFLLTAVTTFSACGSNSVESTPDSPFGPGEGPGSNSLNVAVVGVADSPFGPGEGPGSNSLDLPPLRP